MPTVFAKAFHSGLADLPPFYRTWQHCPAYPIPPDSGPLSKIVFLPSAREVLPEAKSWVPPPARGVLVEAKGHSCHRGICHVEWFLLFLPWVTSSHATGLLAQLPSVSQQRYSLSVGTLLSCNELASWCPETIFISVILRPPHLYKSYS